MFMYQDLNREICRLVDTIDSLKKSYHKTKDKETKNAIIEQILNLEEEIKDLLCNECSRK